MGELKGWAEPGFYAGSVVLGIRGAGGIRRPPRRGRLEQAPVRIKGVAMVWAVPGDPSPAPHRESWWSPALRQGRRRSDGALGTGPLPENGWSPARTGKPAGRQILLNRGRNSTMARSTDRHSDPSPRSGRGVTRRQVLAGAGGAALLSGIAGRAGAAAPAAQDGAVVADDVTADELGLFAAFEGKGRHGQRLSRRHEPAAIALIEPLRRDTHLSGRGFAAFEPQTEHAH